MTPAYSRSGSTTIRRMLSMWVAEGSMISSRIYPFTAPIARHLIPQYPDFNSDRV
jgi:hypothetical protein